uniref:Uncharacterized protein n=1 Tax=Romanomermis culicivorax TaxID=13658 RepID=A0A915JU64_ROMCU
MISSRKEEDPILKKDQDGRGIKEFLKLANQNAIFIVFQNYLEKMRCTWKEGQTSRNLTS